MNPGKFWINIENPFKSSLYNLYKLSGIFFPCVWYHNEENVLCKIQRTQEGAF